MTPTRSLLAVADDGFEGDGDADLVEFFGQVEGVGVLSVGREHFGADCDDFRFHGSSFQLLGFCFSSGAGDETELWTLTIRQMHNG